MKKPHRQSREMVTANGRNEGGGEGLGEYLGVPCKDVFLGEVEREGQKTSLDPRPIGP